MNAARTYGEGREDLGRIYDAEPTDMLNYYERARLLDQNIVRRYRYETAWNVVADPFSPNTQYAIDFDTATSGEMMSGDRWDPARYQFVCQVPGVYNMKGLFEGVISLPASDDIQISRVGVYYVKNEDAPIRLGKAYAQVIAGPTKTWIYAWSITLADSVELDKGDKVKIIWDFAGLLDITYLEDFYARILFEKIADLYTKDAECC